MAYPNELNEQVVEAVIASNLSVTGDAVSQSRAVGLESLAHSLALIMHNNGTAQFNGEQVAGAAVASTCATILNAAKSG